MTEIQSLMEVRGHDKTACPQSGYHLKDHESKKASTINVYTAAIRFFFEYTLGYVWDSKKIPKMKRLYAALRLLEAQASGHAFSCTIVLLLS